MGSQPARAGVVMLMEPATTALQRRLTDRVWVAEDVAELWQVGVAGGRAPQLKAREWGKRALCACVCVCGRTMMAAHGHVLMHALTSCVCGLPKEWPSSAAGEGMQGRVSFGASAWC